MKKFKIILLLIIFVMMPFTFVACEKSNVFSLSTPSGLRVENGTIIFDDVKDAEYYTIYINDNSFNLDAKNKVNGVEIVDGQVKYDASKMFVYGSSYVVKVQAKSSQMYSSKVSNAFSYKHEVTASLPTDVTITGTTLTWKVLSSEKVSFYKIKIIMPYDTYICDYDGNLLTKDDAISIEQANITQVTTYSNYLDFSSILTDAGKYSFYVKAVYSNGLIYSESGFTEKVTYTKIEQLDTPKILSVIERDDQLLLSTIVDENANAVELAIRDVSKVVELNTENSYIQNEQGVFLINLTELFKSSTIDLSSLGNYSITLKALRIADNDNFYKNSLISEEKVFTNKLVLDSIDANITQDNGTNYIEWQDENSEFVSGYNVLILGKENASLVFVPKGEKTSYPVGDFVAGAVQVVGNGINVLNSNFGEFVSNPDLTENGETPSIIGNTISWTNVGANYYVLIDQDKYYVSSSNSFTLTDEQTTRDKIEFALISVFEDKIISQTNFSVQLSRQLSAPTIGGNGFVDSKNPYLLTFNKVNDAVGYYVYVLDSSSDEMIKIDRLFTDNSIDLSKELRGKSSDSYQIRIQAVADPNSNYLPSELSEVVVLNHNLTLATPKFLKDSLGNDVPIIPVEENGTKKFILRFMGVDNAYSYEIWVGFDRLIKYAQPNTTLYEFDVTDYLRNAGQYSIKIKALPSEDSVNFHASAEAEGSFKYTKQLNTVQNIKVTSSDGLEILSFTPQDNAYAYRIKIVKLDNPDVVIFNTQPYDGGQAIDITEYLIDEGIYYVYVTSLPDEESFYIISDEACINEPYVKLQTTLKTPENICFMVKNNEYYLNWTGDSRADYYTVVLTDPFGITRELRSYQNSLNVNKYITIQGQYFAKVYSIASNSTTYLSSTYGSMLEPYLYIMNNITDFERYGVSIYGQTSNFLIDNANDLKIILWYHYLSGINPNIGLALYINCQEDETLTDAIIRLANEAEENAIYQFSNDTEWKALTKLSGSGTITASSNQLFEVVAKRIISVYPEKNVLSNFSLTHESGSQKFSLFYENSLEFINGQYVEKTKINETALNPTVLDFESTFKYVDKFNRRGSLYTYIDGCEKVPVQTSEELLQAVLEGKQPEFYGNCTTAKTIYNNAKQVLNSIITYQMTDVEKAQAIFDWIEHALNLNDNADKTLDGANVVSASLEVYGIRDQFYLESVFLNLYDETRQGFDGEFYLGNRLVASSAYAKAFSLLCGMEGIETVVVNGTYNYTIASTTFEENHSWNKINISTGTDNEKHWYNVDVALSDRLMYADNLSLTSTSLRVATSSHTYFLVTDAFINSKFNLTSNTNPISQTFKETHACDTEYDYYSNSSFALKAEDILANFNQVTECEDCVYLNKYNSTETYQKYNRTGYGELQAFILNKIMLAQMQINSSSANKTMIEFKIDMQDNSNLDIFSSVYVNNVLIDKSLNNWSIGVYKQSTEGIYSIKDSVNKTLTVIVILSKN